MRRTVSAVSTGFLLALARAAWAHGDPHELGHHWSIGEYRSEMWFQISAMAFAVVAYVLVLFGVRAWKRHGIQRR